MTVGILEETGYFDLEEEEWTGKIGAIVPFLVEDTGFIEETESTEDIILLKTLEETTDNGEVAVAVDI